jgi:hypothetical protein
MCVRQRLHLEEEEEEEEKEEEFLVRMAFAYTTQLYLPQLYLPN